MRERFIAILVGLTLGVLVLYGVPRAYFLAEMVEEQETTEISRAATFTANRIESRIRSGTALDEQALRDLDAAYAEAEAAGVRALTLRGEGYVTTYYVNDADKRAVEVHIANLRRKIGDSSSTPRWIETVRGVGYRLAV